MITKINRKDFIQRFPEFPQANYYKNVFHYPDSYNNYILTVEAKSTIGVCKNLCSELSKLASILKYDNLLFLGDTTTPWLFRDHDYKPVKSALEYLSQNKVSKTFAGGLNVTLEELKNFTKHLFWLVRCNGIVFIPHFSDSEFNLVGSICQYGNIHISTLNQMADHEFNAALSKTNLKITGSERCSDPIFKRKTIA